MQVIMQENQVIRNIVDVLSAKQDNVNDNIADSRVVLQT